MTNRLEFVLLLFASWRLGATITPVNPSLTDVEVVRQLDDSDARLLVVEDGARALGGVATLAVGDLYEEAVGSAQAPHVDASALALLIYTSGTTGVPKGVMLDHANLDAMADMGRQSLEASERRVAKMAAGGMTNREIAQALFVTLRTVEVHLSHAYQKLDIASREHLARALQA